MVGAGSIALALHAPTVVATEIASAQTVTSAANPAIDVLADVIRDFLEHIDAFGGPEKHKSYGLREKYYAWVDLKNEELQAKLVATLQQVYSHPLMAEIKRENGSIMSEPNRMNCYAQLLFTEYIPMSLQYAGTPRVFEAFASFAPAHLL